MKYHKLRWQYRLCISESVSSICQCWLHESIEQGISLKHSGDKDMNIKTRVAVAATLVASLCGVSASATELVIATVNNGHMIEMQKLSSNFETANPGITLKWVTLEEGVLRQRVTTDIATKGGQFDVMTIGMYETPIWGKKGWLKELKTDAAYDANDILPAMKDGLSVDGKMFAAPFYGESSMLMYRKDLADKAGITVADKPTWTDIKPLAAKKVCKVVSTGSSSSTSTKVFFIFLVLMKCRCSACRGCWRWPTGGKQIPRQSKVARYSVIVSRLFPLVKPRRTSGRMVYLGAILLG